MVKGRYRKVRNWWCFSCKNQCRDPAVCKEYYSDSSEESEEEEDEEDEEEEEEKEEVRMTRVGNLRSYQVPQKRPLIKPPQNSRQAVK